MAGDDVRQDLSSQIHNRDSVWVTSRRWSIYGPSVHVAQQFWNVQLVAIQRADKTLGNRGPVSRTASTATPEATVSFTYFGVSQLDGSRSLLGLKLLADSYRTLNLQSLTLPSAFTADLFSRLLDQSHWSLHLVSQSFKG